MTEAKNILLVGVGGQGTILIGKILANGLMAAGYDVKMSEVHGMAQRGGSVSNQLRFGKKIYSPIFGIGQADILVSFEVMEALRWLEYLNPIGKILVNVYKIPSAPILTGEADYPEGVLDTLKEKASTCIIRAADIAERLGNPKAMNVVLFGALVKVMGLTHIHWQEAIRRSIKPNMLVINLEAFEAGMTAVGNP